MAAEARPLLLATRSKGKLRELHGILDEFGLAGIDVAGRGIPWSDEEDLVERFDTFEANALAKARYFHERSGGLPTLGDDSGLCVVALGGAPGVWSKRYSGRDDLSGQQLDDANNAKLLEELGSAADWSASYSCAAAFVDDEMEVVTIRETHGTILREPRGDGGFGYDPYFLSRELHHTFGEASIEDKALISHRGRAFRALFAALRERGWSL